MNSISLPRSKGYLELNTPPSLKGALRVPWLAAPLSRVKEGLRARIQGMFCANKNFLFSTVPHMTG